MRTYLDYIRGKIENKEGSPTERFVNLRRLVTFFHNEVVYLAYKYSKDQFSITIADVEELKKAYCFNDMAWNAFSWSGSAFGMGWLEDLIKSKQMPNKGDMEFALYYPDMQDYAFYDGTPVKEVIEELNQVKDKYYL